MQYQQVTAQEVWKDVKDYEGHYKVSNYGRIKCVKFFKTEQKYRDKIISTIVDKAGYEMVILRISGIKVRFSVHRLVAVAFIQPMKESHTIINHKNGVKTDNRVENLEWCDRKYNMIHAINELGVKRNGSDNPNSKYTEDQVQRLRDLHNGGMSVYMASKLCGFPNTTGAYILKGKLRKQLN